jgi:hypothetical protein
MILAAILVALLWATAVGRLPTLWRDRRQRALWATVFALALCKTAEFPPVAAVLHAPVLPHLFGVVAALGLLRFVALATGAGGRRWHFALALVVLVLLVALASVAGGIDTSDERLSGDLTPAVVAYWLVLEAYVGAVTVTATVLFFHVGRAAPAGLLRLGMWAMTAGLAVIALYTAVEAALIVAHALGAPVDFRTIEPATRVVLAGADLLALTGSLVPTTQRARAATAAYRSLMVLRPLWKAMRDAFPEIILFSPRRAVIELAGVDDVHLRLYRRVIEIRDGMLALRDHLPEGLPAADDPALTEARGIALALRRRATGWPSYPPERQGGWAVVGPEMADEVAWLGRVSSAYRRLDPAEISPGAARTPRPSGSAR